MLFPSWDERHPPQGSSTHNTQIDPQRLHGGKLQRSIAALQCVEKMGPGTGATSSRQGILSAPMGAVFLCAFLRAAQESTQK